MKLNKSKMALCLLVVSAATSSIMAHAEVFSQPSNDTVDLTFASTLKATKLTLTKAATLPTPEVSANSGLNLISVKNESTGGAIRLGIRFTPNINNQDAVAGTGKATIHGENTFSNQMKVIFSGGSNVTWQTVGTDKYLVSNANATTQSLNVSLDGAQTLHADSYIVSLDSAQYTP